MADPILFGTQKDYAWDAWRTASCRRPEDETISKKHFEEWWDSYLSNVPKFSLEDLFRAAWNTGASNTDKIKFESWWQEILDKQPGETPTPTSGP